MNTEYSFNNISLSKTGIFSNNLLLEHILPDEYTSVKYIQSTGNCAIDTGLAPVPGLNMILKAYCTTTSSLYLLGSRASNSGSYFCNFSGSSTGSTVSGGINGTSVTTEFTRTSSGQLYLQELYSTSDSLQFKYINHDMTNNVMFSSSWTSYSTFSTTKNIFLFSDGYHYVGGTTRIFYFILFFGDEIQRFMIPCYNTELSVGMYDLVTKTFFINTQEDYSFTAGPEFNYCSIFEEIVSAKSFIEI